MTQPQSSNVENTDGANSETSPTKPMSTQSPQSITRETLRSIRENRTRKPDTDITDTEEPHPQSETSGVKCEECGGDVIHDADTNERACEDCGLIIEERAGDVDPAWEHSSAIEHIVNATVTTNTDSGVTGDALGGTIDWRDKDGYGNSLSAKMRSKYHRQRTLDRQANTDNRKRSEYNYALGEINRIGVDLAIPNPVIDRATALFESLLKDDKLSGRSIDTVATSVLIIACDEYDVSRSFDEFTERTHASSVEVESVRGDVVRLLGIDDRSKDITEFAGAFCNELNAGSEARSVAETVLMNGVSEELFEDGDLKAYTAAAVYLGCIRTGVIRQQSEVAEQTGVDEKTLTRKYQELVESASV